MVKVSGHKSPCGTAVRKEGASLSLPEPLHRWRCVPARIRGRGGRLTCLPVLSLRTSKGRGKGPDLLVSSRLQIDRDKDPWANLQQSRAR